MQTLIALILALASTVAAADYTDIVMTPGGTVMCTNINGVPVCR